MLSATLFKSLRKLFVAAKKFFKFPSSKIKHFFLNFFFKSDYIMSKTENNVKDCVISTRIEQFNKESDNFLKKTFH